MIGEEEIRRRFGSTATAPKSVRSLHDLLREEFIQVAIEVDHHCDDGRVKSLALTALEEASMWAQKSLANTEMDAKKAQGD